MIARRNFLGGLAGILAAGSAPAIIHDAMKIVVPKQDIVLNVGRGLTTPIIHVDESPIQGSFNRSGPTQRGGEATKWLAREDAFGEAFYPTIVFNTPEAETNFMSFMSKHRAQMKRREVFLRRSLA